MLDDALTRAASEERETLARVVAGDAREASWMAAASFFNTIAHRAGLFQAAAHNVPAVALPTPSLDKWSPAADAAVKGVAAQLARSRGYHPMLLSAATAGAGALPAPKAEGGMVSGLLEFIDLDSVIVAESGNPIADLAALGHGLLNAALAALMGAATGSGLLESIPFIGKGLDVFESAWQVPDEAGHGMAGIENLVLDQRLHGLEAASTGDHGIAVGVFRVGSIAADDEVFQQAEGGDRGLELGVGPGIGRGLADVLGGEREPAQRDLPDERFGPGGDEVHANLHGGLHSRGGDGALRPSRARPGPARLHLRAELPGGTDTAGRRLQLGRRDRALANGGMTRLAR